MYCDLLQVDTSISTQLNTMYRQTVAKDNSHK